MQACWPSGGFPIRETADCQSALRCAGVARTGSPLFRRLATGVSPRVSPARANQFVTMACEASQRSSPRVAPGAQPWADCLQRRWRSAEVRGQPVWMACGCRWSSAGGWVQPGDSTARSPRFVPWNRTERGSVTRSGSGRTVVARASRPCDAKHTGATPVPLPRGSCGKSEGRIPSHFPANWFPAFQAEWRLRDESASTPSSR